MTGEELFVVRGRSVWTSQTRPLARPANRQKKTRFVRNALESRAFGLVDQVPPNMQGHCRAHKNVDFVDE